MGTFLIFTSIAKEIKKFRNYLIRFFILTKPQDMNQNYGYLKIFEKYTIWCMSETKPLSSVSETLEKNTIEIIKKLESSIPLHIKSFSDFSREYMKLLEKVYDINYTLENKMFGNFGLNEKSINMLDSYLGIGSKYYASQIEISNEFFKSYLKMRLSMMESYNRFLNEFSINFKSNTVETIKK